MKKTAFTLAEVLITLTIIGVIAAITIPNLIQNYQEHATVNKVKKFYSTLTNAYAQAIKENGPVDEWGIGTTQGNADNGNSKKIYDIIIKQYFKVTKDCGTNNNGSCITNNNYKKLNKQLVDGNFATWPNYYKVLLSDGSALIIRPNYPDEITDKIFEIFLDTNGTKKPNTWGKDLFTFYIYKDKVVPAAPNEFDSGCAKPTHTGARCAAWLIYKGNMDYLHCSDLSWNGKNKCSK